MKIYFAYPIIKMITKNNIKKTILRIKTILRYLDKNGYLYLLKSEILLKYLIISELNF